MLPPNHIFLKGNSVFSNPQNPRSSTPETAPDQAFAATFAAVARCAAPDSRTIRSMRRKGSAAPQSNWSPIRYTLGVSKLVTFGNVPAAVPDEFIEVLQTAPQRAAQHMLNSGDEVTFIDGPLRGLKGIFQQRDGELRAMVLIELLSRPQTIATALQDLRPVAA